MRSAFAALSLCLLAGGCDCSRRDVAGSVAGGCAEDPHSEGCPCAPEDFQKGEACYSGPEGTAEVGSCVPGVRVCGLSNSRWTACSGEILPEEEQCDRVDNDCDGTVDEQVRNECGACGECRFYCAGPDEECYDWTPDEIGEGLAETSDGFLVLEDEALEIHVIWPVSTGSGDIFRIDTTTLEITGQFWTGPDRPADTTLNPYAPAYQTNNCPSGTAVDEDGDVVIANQGRGLHKSSSITRIEAEPGQCPDQDDDGTVQTSTGLGDRLDFATHEDWSDECVLWHTIVGDNLKALARAVVLQRGIGLDGVIVRRGWVAISREKKFQEFDSVTGELTGIEAQTEDFSPQDAAIDRDGVVWTVGGSKDEFSSGRFDTADPGSFELVALPAKHLAQYVHIDENNVPWVSGSEAFRREEELERWDAMGTTPDILDAPAAGIASDGDGSVFVGSGRTSGEALDEGLGVEVVARIDNDSDPTVRFIATPGVVASGMAVDHDGHAWGFDFWTGRAIVIDLVTETVEPILEDCGGPCLSFPDVRGDPSGFARHQSRALAGEWVRVIEGCQPTEQVTWIELDVDALVPDDTFIAVAVRTAATLPDLPAAPIVHLGTLPDDGSEFDLEAAFRRENVAAEGVLEVHVGLESRDREATPTLRRVDLVWSCSAAVR